jgi:predicted nucleic acid-binding protein
VKLRTIVDTGPLVAYIAGYDHFHTWSQSAISDLKPPLHTCEPVLTEALFLLERGKGGDPGDLFDLVERGVVVPSFRISENTARIRKLMAKYRNLPMSLADACLVVMSEQNEGARVLTLDSHFRIYRLSDRRVIPVIMPDLKESNR